MRSILALIGESAAAKIGAIAAAIVVLGAGAAVALPGGPFSQDRTAEAHAGGKSIGDAALLAQFAEHCAEEPNTSYCSGPSLGPYDGE